MSKENTTLERVQKVLRDQLMIDTEDQIAAEKKVSDNADSLDMVEIAMALEEEFGIEIPDDEFENSFDLTVNDLTKIVDKYAHPS